MDVQPTLSGSNGLGSDGSRMDTHTHTSKVVAAACLSGVSHDINRVKAHRLGLMPKSFLG